MKLSTLKPRLQVVTSKLATVSAGSWRSGCVTSAQRGYGYKWQKARAAYLLVHPFCVYCLREHRIKSGATESIILECAERGVALPHANIVDHIVPHRGDKALFWRSDNWQSLCAPCHSGKKQKEEFQAWQIQN